MQYHLESASVSSSRCLAALAARRKTDVWLCSCVCELRCMQCLASQTAVDCCYLQRSYANHVSGGGWGGGGGGGGGFREEDPFAADNARKAEADGLFAADNTGIDFDAYEDIPVEATGEGVPEPIHSFTGEWSAVCWS